MDWQAEQERDNLNRQQRLVELISLAGDRPLTEPERIEIAVEVGLASFYRKHYTSKDTTK